MSTVTAAIFGHTPPSKLTEADAAEYLAHQHGQDLRFDHRRNRWLMWQGHRWGTDAAGHRGERVGEFGIQLAGRVSGQVPKREQVRLSNGVSAALIVELNKKASLETKYATLVHELAHVYCGHLGVVTGAWWPARTDLGYRRCEFEAEAVAWIVCARQGLDPGSYRYLEGFLGADRHIPDVSLNQIMVAANHIETLASETWRRRRVDARRTPEPRPTIAADMI